MNEREAMKLALEFADDVFRGNYKGNADEVITAIREALAQQPVSNPDELAQPEQSWIERERAVGYREGHQAAIRQMANGIHFDSPPLNRPEQEQMAYDKTELNCFAQDLYDQKMREGKRGHYESMFHVIHQCIEKVAPPHRKPLSDEEFQKICTRLSRQGGWDGDGWDLALKEAIEAAHGIKE